MNDTTFDLALALGADVASEFSLPNTRVPLVFAEGEDRLVGAVLPGAGPSEPPDPPQPFPPNPFPPPARCCGGKSLWDGVPAGCGAGWPHRPHSLDREPVLSQTP